MSMKTLSDMSKINIQHAQHSPSTEQLSTLLSALCSDGRLYKLGSCFVDLLDTRPYSASQYNGTFDTKDAMCVAYGITNKQLAESLETAGIGHLKHTLHVGVNFKDKDAVPHGAISPARPQALYIVPVVRTIKTQAQFKTVHLSDYKLKQLAVPPPPKPGCSGCSKKTDPLVAMGVCAVRW